MKCFSPAVTCQFFYGTGEFNKIYGAFFLKPIINHKISEVNKIILSKFHIIQKNLKLFQKNTCNLQNNVILFYLFQTTGCGAVGSALDWGSRGREFKSRHSDQSSYESMRTFFVPEKRCSEYHQH